MNMILTNICNKLISRKTLTKEEFAALLDNNSIKLRQVLQAEAAKVRKEIFGNSIYIRGLIEFTNHCHNNCYYCGIRRDNHNLHRYRLSASEIIDCCTNGYHLGFRTFVLQGGEDSYWKKHLCQLVTSIRNQFPDCAITLSVGELPKESYLQLFQAGANRYLLRHETACSGHYQMLHPDEMCHSHRMECLHTIKEIGFQTGCGFMVGSPFQTKEMIAEDLLFIQDFHPHMVGIGPFIPHKDTPFAKQPPGTLEDTLLLLSILRLLQPNLLLPATTALGTIHPQGLALGIQAGANVIMPNLSPIAVRKDYALYNNKINTNSEAAEYLSKLKIQMQNIGYEIVTDIGNAPM